MKWIVLIAAIYRLIGFRRAAAMFPSGEGTTIAGRARDRATISRGCYHRGVAAWWLIRENHHRRAGGHDAA